MSLPKASASGVLQPILVRPQIYGGYQIVAGERRYRASRLAGLSEIPAIVRELSDSETMQIALIENLQRRDLSPLEEAKGYKTLMDEYDFSQEEVARTVGKSRPAVANILRLLSLPEDVKPLLEDGSLSAGHARAILSIEDEALATETAQKVVKEGLSVRETENLTRKLGKAKKPKKKASSPSKPPTFTEVELALSETMGTKVKVSLRKDDTGGTLSVDFNNPAELFLLANKIEKLWNDTAFFDDINES